MAFCASCGKEAAAADIYCSKYRARQTAGPAIFFGTIIVAILASIVMADQVPPQQSAPSQPLRVAMKGNYLPLHGYENGQAVGLEADLARALGKLLSREVTFLGPDLKVSSIDAVATGKADIALSAITPTEFRARAVDFTTPYVTLRYRVLGLRGGPSSMGSKVGVVVDPTIDMGVTDRALRSTLGLDTGYSIVPTISQALEMLHQGRLDFIVAEDVAVLSELNRGRDHLRLVHQPFGSAPIAMAVPKGQAEHYNRLLEQLSPLLKELIAKWKPGVLDEDVSGGGVRRQVYWKYAGNHYKIGPMVGDPLRCTEVSVSGSSGQILVAPTHLGNARAVVGEQTNFDGKKVSVKRTSVPCVGIEDEMPPPKWVSPADVARLPAGEESGRVSARHAGDRALARSTISGGNEYMDGIIVKGPASCIIVVWESTKGNCHYPIEHMSPGERLFFRDYRPLEEPREEPIQAKSPDKAIKDLRPGDAVIKYGYSESECSEPVEVSGRVKSVVECIEGASPTTGRTRPYLSSQLIPLVPVFP